MALIYSSEPCQTAGTFTSNVVKAAPVKWDRKLVEESAYTQAVVVNAGIANACTGEEGMEYCRRTAECAGKELDIPTDAVLVASTGVIGMQLPMDRICEGIRSMAPQLSEELAAGNGAAKAIMTTDTHEKEAAVTFTTVDGAQVTVEACARAAA